MCVLVFFGYARLNISKSVLILTGKTNHGQKLYGRAMRHKSVSLCPIGGLSFYLAMRFSITHEFDDMTMEDWAENSRWFDVKLLVEARARGTDNTKEMSNDTYGKAMKQVLQHLLIPSNHWVHLGRVMGPKILEFLEAEAEEIRQLGNWDPKQQELCYSTKLPMRAIRQIGGFAKGKGVHWNPRTVVDVPIDLRLATPFGFAKGKLDCIREVMVHNREFKWTAMAFLKFVWELSTIFIQDAAAMMIERPERSNHPIFRLDVFQRDDFQVRCWLIVEFAVLLSRFSFLTPLIFSHSILQIYVDKMRNELEIAKGNDPFNHSVETVLPGVHSRMQATHSEVVCLRNDLSRLEATLSACVGQLMTQQQAFHQAQRERDEVLGRALLQQAQSTPLPVKESKGSLDEDGVRKVDDDKTQQEQTYRMRMKHSNLRDVVDEWMGRGKWAGIPMEGGIEAMEMTHKAKWRRHWSSSEVKHYSRTKMVIIGLRKKEKDEKKEMDVVIEEFEARFQENGRSIAKMASLMQEMGFVPKQKARGRKRKADEEGSG